MIVVSYYYIVYGFLIQTLFGSLTGFRIYDFHNLCTNTINDEAGELRFDAQKQSSYFFGHKCSVTVQPSSNVLPKPIRVSFYFTKFDLSETCEYVNVTVQEGSTFTKPVQGLPRHLCGHNTSLEDSSQIFTTRGDIFTVTFQRKSVASFSRWNFTIKFIAFYLGKCEKDDLFECNNRHCIARDYMCSDDINSCGDQGDHKQGCEIYTAVTKFVESIVDFFRKYSWIIPVLIGLCVLKCCWKRIKRKYRSSSCNICERFSNCFGSIRRRITSFQSRRNSTPTRRNSLQLQNHQNSPSVRPVQAIENDQDTENTSDEFDDLPSSDSESLNEYPASRTQTRSREAASPEAPPPSYDEVMSTSDATPSAPPYEEVMKNRHKYNETDI